MIKVLIVFGTRPEAIKVAPVIQELKNYPGKFKVVTCATAQHRRMLDQVLDIFTIKADMDLDIMQKNQTLYSLTSRVMERVSRILEQVKPDLVLVQGDTTTAMVVSLAAFYQKIPVGHIEAGLRTHDIYNPFPEEVNRRLISVLSTLNFAPTKTAAAFLRTEGIDKKRIFLTGNTVVDALRMISRHACSPPHGVVPTDTKIILVTAHRRENFGQPLRNICAAIRAIAEENKNVHIVYPVHLNPNVNRVVHQRLHNHPRITLIPPVDYRELVWLLKKSYLVLTDSGGIQEEAPTFGKPVIVMREVTERPEGIRAGVAQLAGTDTGTIVKKVTTLLNNKKAYARMARAGNPYGDGKAAQRISRAITAYFRL